MNPPREDLIWKGHPSHVRNFWPNLVALLTAGVGGVGAALALLFWHSPSAKYVALVLAVLAAAALGVWLWRRIELSSHVYELTSERLRITSGILAKRTEELELYRVRDTTFFQPFVYRLFGRGDIILNTTDASTPSLTLECVPAGQELRDRLRAAIEACRDRKQTRVAEMDVVEDGGSARST